MNKTMSIGCLGIKIGMTQVFNDKGESIPVTVIKTDTCYITQIKEEKICGYNAIQLGFSEFNSRNIKKFLTKPEMGHLLKKGLPLLKHLKEYKVDSVSKFKVGDKISTADFQIGDLVTISGKTIGKGNAGNIKKHHFSRGPMSHGSKHHRAQGSLGAGTTPSRVFPGKKMPGRLGNQKQTLKNLQVVGLDHDNHLILIKGSIPGKFGNLVSVSKL